MRTILFTILFVCLAISFLANCGTTRKTTTSEQETRKNLPLDSTLILNIVSQEESIAKGKASFNQFCSICHGQLGEGGIGPNLTDEYWLHGGGTLDIARTITYGIPEMGMRPWHFQFQAKEIGEIVAFIHSIQGSNPENAKVPQGKKQ